MQENQELKQDVKVIKNDIAWIKQTLENLVSEDRLDTVKEEMKIHRWILGGFFTALIVLIGWTVGAA